MSRRLLTVLALVAAAVLAGCAIQPAPAVYDDFPIYSSPYWHDAPRGRVVGVPVHSAARGEYRSANLRRSKK